jgi:hypothetical protein
MKTQLLITVALFIGIPAMVRLRAAALLTSPRFEQWARRFGLTLTAATTNYVRTHLAIGMRWRHRGGAIGFGVACVPSVIQTVLNRSIGMPSLSGLMFLGYLGGTALAEGVRWRRGLVGVARATLDRRSVADYVAGWTRLTMWTLLVIGVVLVPIAYADAFNQRTRLGVVITGFVVVIAGGLTEWALRAIARRPQAATDADLVAADNALRSYSSPILVGLAIGVIAYALMPLAGDRIVNWGGLAKTIATWVVILGPLLLITLARYIGCDQPWTHRSAATSRPSGPVAGQVPA